MSLVIQEARALEVAKDLLTELAGTEGPISERARYALKHYPLAAASRWADHELSTERYVSDHERKEIRDEYGV